MSAQLHVIDTPMLQDAPSKLRELADAIEGGEHGEVQCVGIVVLGDTLSVYGAGPKSEGPAVALLFQAAIHRLALMLLETDDDAE